MPLLPSRRAPLLRRLTLAAALAAPAALLTLPASAQRSARPASTEAFSFCRAQEQLGDARACWSVWLEKHRKASSEAELAYAETHSQAAQAPGRLRLTSTPSASLTLDGRDIGRTPRESVEVLPGDHRIAFVHEGRSEGRTVKVTAGEVRAVDVDFTVPAAGSRSAPAAVPAASLLPGGEVLDFCALTPREGAKKERIVLLAPAGSGQLNDDARLRSVDAAALVRDVFSARFAIARFHNVLGSFPGKKGWEKREWLSLLEVRAYLDDPRSEDSADDTARIARERPFVSYSLGCADYVVIPSITSHETTWDAKNAGGPTFKLDAVLGIFRRQGGSFRRIALLSAGVPSFATRAHRAASPNAAPPAPAEVAPHALPGYVSAVPDPACVAGKVATDGVGALAPCGSRGEGTVEQALGGLDEHRSTACQRARDESIEGDERLTSSMKCEVRTRAFELARALQEDSRQVDGWNLFAMLAHPSSPSFALGRAEGVKIGDAFEVLDRNNERIAFLKATKIGPGGAAGEHEHTLLDARLGEAPEGARIDVYPQLGLVVAPYASIAMVTYSYGTTRVRSGIEHQDFTLPDVVYGAGGTLGYDLSSLLRSNETFVRVGAGIFTGNGLNTSAQLVPLDLWIEKGFYLARRLTLTTALGGTLQLSSVSLLTTIGPHQEDLHVSSATYGPAGRVGLDVMLRPGWSVKLDVALRVPLNSASYSESDGKPIPAEWQSREDHLATMGANLGFAKTF